MSEKTFWQTIETTGEQVAATIKELIEAGNVRRIRVAALGALTAVLSESSIEVERVEPKERN